MEISTSEFTMTDGPLIESAFTDFEEIETFGFNWIIKARRYGQWYILKGLKPQYASQQLYVELLKKEFEVSVRLSHPGIVHTIGFEKVPDFGYCIVFEYVKGETLKKYLTKEHSKEERRRVADQLIDAVGFIHQQQIVHRDLKPENILIASNGNNVKIIDFGLSDTDAYAILKQPAGTLNYISPEQRSSAGTDSRNDLYSLGKILLEINAGFFYNRTARHCLRDIESRCQHAEDMKKEIRHCRLYVKIAFYSLLTLLCVLSLAIPLKDQSEQAFAKNRLEMAVEVGKKRIDQMTLPVTQFRNFLSEHPELSTDMEVMNEYTDLSVKRILGMEKIIDSLSEDFGIAQRTYISVTLRTYFMNTSPELLPVGVTDSSSISKRIPSLLPAT